MGNRLRSLRFHGRRGECVCAAYRLWTTNDQGDDDDHHHHREQAMKPRLRQLSAATFEMEPQLLIKIQDCSAAVGRLEAG